MRIPWQGQLIPALHRKYEERIVFVHFFGGRKQNMKRHVELVNELGFDAVTFNLSFNARFWLTRPPISRNHKIGLKHLWADEIEDVLNAIEGNKIIFAFSNPASCAIEALARRKTPDVKALITDSGPFVQYMKCIWNLLTHEYTIRSKFLRLPATLATSMLWGPNHSQSLQDDLKRLPSKFPVLSIRGWKEKTRPPQAIDQAFQKAHQIKLEVLAIPEAGHLNGLKDFPEVYAPRVTKFLKHYSQIYGKTS